MRSRCSLPGKLYLREIRGRFPQAQQVPGSLFRVFPGRLAFCLKDIVPSVSVLASHVFLGFSKCGQFLLSLTQSVEFDDNTREYMQIKYRLHWWLFVPHQPLRKVSEVSLFADWSVECRLLVAVCYWPTDETTLLVYGRPEREADSWQCSRCYITITTVPSLQRCADCVRVAESYCEDEMAHNWDTCVRLSCLRHGLTVHTTFDLVRPFPAFAAHTALCRRNAVLINTGNFLHVLSVRLHCIARPSVLPSSLADVPEADEHYFNNSNSQQRLALLSGGAAAAPAVFSTLAESDSSRPPSASTQPSTADAADWDRLSQCLELDVGGGGGGGSGASQSVDVSRAPWRFDVRALQEPPVVSGRSPRRWPSRLRRCVSSLTRQTAATAAAATTVDEYEFYEDAVEADDREKLSVFRRRRLADKKYEFSDENSENVPRLLDAGRRSWLAATAAAAAGESPDCTTASCWSPLSDRLLSPLSAGGGGGGGGWLSRVGRVAPSSSAAVAATAGGWPDDDVCVLRAINRNTEPDVYGAAPPPPPHADVLQSISPCPASQVGSDVDWSDSVSCVTRPHKTAPQDSHGAVVACCVHLRRHYVEVDDELVSVITDVEEEGSCRVTGYHDALPLDVRGTAYCQLHMVSQNTARRLMLPCVEVHQTSLDVEHFCHDVSQKLCAGADKKYFFCDDYDVEIVEVCADTGVVVAVAAVVIQAADITTTTTNTSSCTTRASSSHIVSVCGGAAPTRNRFHCHFVFGWSPTGRHYTLLSSSALLPSPAPSTRDSAHHQHQPRPPQQVAVSARQLAVALRRSWSQRAPPLARHHHAVVMTNEAELNGASLRSLVDWRNMTALLLNVGGACAASGE